MSNRGLLLFTVIALTGCSTAEPQAASAPTPKATSVTASPTSTSAPAPTTTTASAGDVAACKASMRVEYDANKSIKDLSGIPTPMLVDMFNGWADDLESGTVAADSTELVDGFKGTVAGLRSMAATTKAWKEGSLNLIPDLTVVYEQSDKVQKLCDKADPDGVYLAIVNAA